MNILIDFLPNEVIVDSTEYEINSDFRTSILFELMMQDEDLTEEEKIYQALHLYYHVIPTNLNEAINKLSWFYGGGRNIEQKENANVKIKRVPGKKIKKIYSFEHDSEYIYSAFLSQYSIDLQDIEYLHWWKFKALFNSLNKSNKITEIMGYRAMDISKIQDKEQRKHYKEMQEIYAIPQSKNEIEKINEIEEALLKGEDLTKILNKV